MSKERNMSNARLKDVAEKAGVSIGAAGRVLNGAGASTICVGEKTAVRIRKVAKMLGYQPNLAARQLRDGKSNILGIITHESASDEDLRRIVSIEKAASRENLQVMVTMLDEGRDPREQLRGTLSRFRARGVDGVIALWWELLKLDKDVFEKIPVFFIGPDMLMAGRKGVRINSIEGGRLSVEHLVACGRRRIGFILEEHEFAQGRLIGGLRVLAAHGIQMSQNWIRQGASEHCGNDEFIREAIQELVEKQRVDAIVAENDHWAARMIKLLKRQGVQIPGDVAIIGYNNQTFCDYLDPTLTSMEEREKDIAQDLLSAFLGRKNTEAEVSICPKLVVRQST
jgi:LacI family transcriptional regulator